MLVKAGNYNKYKYQYRRNNLNFFKQFLRISLGQFVTTERVKNHRQYTIRNKYFYQNPKFHIRRNQILQNISPENHDKQGYKQPEQFRAGNLLSVFEGKITVHYRYPGQPKAQIQKQTINPIDHIIKFNNL